MGQANSAHGSEGLHSHNGIANYYATRAAWGLGVRRVVNTRHGMGCVNPQSRREWLFRQAMRLTDVAVAVSKSAGQRLVELKSTPPDKLRIVTNGIHAGPSSASNDAERARTAVHPRLPSHTHAVGLVRPPTSPRPRTILCDLESGE